MFKKCFGQVNKERGKYWFSQGFSLIELIIVIAIIATLTGLLAPNFMHYMVRNRAKVCKQNREAILNIYARSVFDSSTELKIRDDDLGRFIPTAANIYKPAENEILQYGKMPKDHKYTDYHVEAATGTAYITCEECANYDFADEIVSVDLDIGGFTKNTVEESDDLEIPTPTPSPTKAPLDKEWTVNFYMNDGTGATYCEAMTVRDGETCPAPGGTPKRNKLFNFAGWCTDTKGNHPFNFGTPINQNTDVYASWSAVRRGEVWPYADDPTWWDPDLFDHESEVTAMEIGKEANTMYITLKAPSGIFTSLAGGQFVYVAENNDQKIRFYEAMTPEYYSALHPSWLIQLTGHVIEVELTDSNGKDKERVTVNNVTNGDLIRFVERDGTTYEYVYWHSVDNFVMTPSNIRQYNLKLGNMLRVSSEY